MLESMVEWMGYPMYYAFDGATPPPRAGAAHATIFPYGPFLAGDGQTVMLGLQNEREWAAFCQHVLRQPDRPSDERFSSNSRRVSNRQALRSTIVETFASMTADEVLGRLEDAQIANARVNDMHDVWRHPQLRARGCWTEVSTPSGTIPALFPPGRTNAFQPRMGAVPGLGQHSDTILSELGWSADEVAALRDAGVV
jgi:itaconate CoA-transferase